MTWTFVWLTDWLEDFFPIDDGFALDFLFIYQLES